MTDDDIPAGFEPHTRKSPLTDPWEPLYAKREGSAWHLGLRIREAHCNARGFAHGGLISALADNSMGLSLHLAISQSDPDRQLRGALTVSLAIDFVGSVSIGQWLEVFPRVIKGGGSLGFVECIVKADGVAAARGNATFRIG